MLINERPISTFLQSIFRTRISTSLGFDSFFNDISGCSFSQLDFAFGLVGFGEIRILRRHDNVPQVVKLAQHDPLLAHGEWSLWNLQRIIFIGYGYGIKGPFIGCSTGGGGHLILLVDHFDNK